MKKTISLLLCLLMCAPLLLSCTDNGAENGTETGTNTAQNSDTVSSVDAPKLAGIKIAGNDISEYVIVKSMQQRVKPLLQKNSPPTSKKRAAPNSKSFRRQMRVKLLHW